MQFFAESDFIVLEVPQNENYKGGSSIIKVVVPKIGDRIQ